MEIEQQGRPAMAEPRQLAESPRNLVAWWLLGLLNNAGYVIMLAGANQISSAAVGLVYLCAVGPAILCKATGPYWFHLVSYRLRMASVALLMACSYTTVALSSRRAWQLLGVVFASLQGGLGEASCLALTSYYSGQPVITAWSSGTGFAGVFGYTWVATLHVIGGLSFRATLLLANATPLAFLGVYYWLLRPPKRAPPGEALPASSLDRLLRREPRGRGEGTAAAAAAAAGRGRGLLGDRGGRGQGPGRPAATEEDPSERQRLLASQHAQQGGSSGSDGGSRPAPEWQQQQQQQHHSHLGPAEGWGDGGEEREMGEEGEEEDVKVSKVCRMAWRERAERTAALWPYMVPLMVVYFAEYAMQSGTWTAIGFPVEDADARHRFYTYSNWMYQLGVFVSRSSGMLYQATRAELWAMPALQVGWLAFFLADAVHKFWYNWGLLVPCFITGLLGGAVYVNAFTLISKEVEPQLREFSLGAASLADSLGVAAADVTGILIQGCLFKANGMAGADFKC